MRSIILSASLLAACGGAPAMAPQHPLAADVMRGPATGTTGRILVITATCGHIEEECRDSWAPTVDQIVLGGLEFRGYETVDPQTLRKDERKRDERIEEHDSTEKSRHNRAGGGIGFIGILPVGGAGGSDGETMTVSRSRHKTVILEGANYEDLRLEDKQALMQLAGANTVATMRIVVGASYGMWSVAQSVEVVVKFAAADTGEMRWSTRCMANSHDFPNVEAAIESAARCAASAFPAKQ